VEDCWKLYLENFLRHFQKKKKREALKTIGLMKKVDSISYLEGKINSTTL